MSPKFSFKFSFKMISTQPSEKFIFMTFKAEVFNPFTIFTIIEAPFSIFLNRTFTIMFFSNELFIS